MQEEGVITGVREVRATVRVVRSTACEGCSASGTCHPDTGGRNMEVVALNRAGGQVGDRVLVELPSSSLLKAAFLVYLLPVAALIAGALAGPALASSTGLSGEVAGLLGALASLVLSLLVVRRVGRAMAADSRYVPTVSRIL